MVQLIDFNGSSLFDLTQNYHFIQKMLARLLQNTLGYESNSPPPPQPYPHHELLPAHLVGQILQLQMQCEEDTASTDLISKLVSLYAAAVEHYETLGSHKYIVYKKRMQLFLSKHSIESLLEGRKGAMIARREMIERNKLHAVFTTKEEVIRIIKKSDKKAETSRNIISKQINNQKKALEARIERRKSMSNKSTKTDNDDFGDLSEDISQTININFALNGLKQRTAKRVFI